MREDEIDPHLVSYIRALIAAAPARAALQFNRVDFRLPWLRRNFPDAVLIHLYRHPRDQWCSTLREVAAVPPTAAMAEFASHDHYYLLPWARDLSCEFPFLDPDAACHPYELFYLLWRLSFAHGHAYAHASFRFEELCAQPDTQITRIMEAAGVTHYSLPILRRLIDERAAQPKWRSYASADWFEDCERRCEEVLTTIAGSAM